MTSKLPTELAQKLKDQRKLSDETVQYREQLEKRLTDRILAYNAIVPGASETTADEPQRAEVDESNYQMAKAFPGEQASYVNSPRGSFKWLLWIGFKGVLAIMAFCLLLLVRNIRRQRELEESDGFEEQLAEMLRKAREEATLMHELDDMSYVKANELHGEQGLSGPAKASFMKKVGPIRPDAPARPREYASMPAAPQQSMMPPSPLVGPVAPNTRVVYMPVIISDDGAPKPPVFTRKPDFQRPARAM
ncbi:hypothetical protein [Ruficoccus sp. ZRK36]|uniref:hypothetical protein n=1 Tax=Ruficoccus sp. ZRK36 TaxID=2866311 RepID=UPI001C736B04|nr:hypothetical protein [Ruficoccus sp. ZRK36]QYY35756.1 hypothetical protein K0V07_15835 [Ruficoccus sp. ZRK36]